MLTTLHKLLRMAKKERFAIPAFNVTNLETIQAVIRAAVRARSPVIVQTSEGAIEYAGHATLLAMIEFIARHEGGGVPIVTHLDHGKHAAIVRRAIELGYRSVHMDASERRWRENVSLTRAAVALGHRHRITVQGELGYLPGYEGMTRARFDRRIVEMGMTDPDQAQVFVQKTKVDTLAVACGTAHGLFRGREKIDFKRLKAIVKKVHVPLVLHGGSGLPTREIRRAIALGIRIVNIDTELRIAFLLGLRTSMRTFNVRQRVNVRKHLGEARLTMEREAITLMKLLKSAGKA